MNCWEILGIEPTGDHQQIQHAYEQQLKFASTEDARRIEQAFNEAVSTRALDASESQIAREVIIQVKALLNNSNRSSDVDIWRAILCEAPADQPLLRSEIGRQLEPQLRPMAENGSFPASVMHFLGDWFSWNTLVNVQGQGRVDDVPHSEAIAPEPEGGQPPQMVNFWPAVIGWIIGLIILASLFGGMGGN